MRVTKLLTAKILRAPHANTTFFALPLFAPQTTTTQDALFYDELKSHCCRSTAGSDKKYFMKRNNFTDYNEDRIKFYGKAAF